MKYRIAILEQLKSQSHFDKQAIRQLGEQYGLKNSTIDAYIAQSIKLKQIIPLRKGLYVSADFYGKNKRDISYGYYLANIMRRPSYVSSWTALQYYNLTTEVIHAITCVTTRVTRSYRSKAGTFVYQSVKPDLFSGFALGEGKFDFYIASQAKALFDLLYLRTRQFRGMDFDDIDPLIEELRIDIDEMDEQNRQTFYSLTRDYMNDE